MISTFLRLLYRLGLRDEPIADEDYRRVHQLNKTYKLKPWSIKNLGEE